MCVCVYIYIHPKHILERCCRRGGGGDGKMLVYT